MGKVTVIKPFALPKLVLQFTVLPNPPNEIITDITRRMFSFIWNNKPDKIKREQLCNQKENGGLGLPNISLFMNSIKAGWVKRYLDKNNQGQWKIFISKILEKRWKHSF